MKTKKFLLLVGITLVLFTPGCQEKAAEVTVKDEAGSREIKEVAPAKVMDPAMAGVLRGRVLFQGTAPAPQKISVGGNPECAALHPDGSITSEELLVNGGALQNVFVYVREGVEGQSFSAPAEAVTVNNKNCTYIPHVVGVQVGQSVNILNSDPTLHNVHSYSKNSKSWNIGLPIQGMKQVKKFEAPEVMVALKCDVHPWMRGYIGVLPHPYFSVTDSSGAFEIKNLPPGEYVIEAWHEKLGAQSQKVRIEPQSTETIEFVFS